MGTRSPGRRAVRGRGRLGAPLLGRVRSSRETSFRTAHAVRKATDLALSIDHGRAAVIALDAQHVASAGLLRFRHCRGEAEQSSKDQQEAGASQDVLTHVELLSEKPRSPSWAARAAAQLMYAPTGVERLRPGYLYAWNAPDRGREGDDSKRLVEHLLERVHQLPASSSIPADTSNRKSWM